MYSAYRIGPAKSFKVFPGDVITGSVSAYFTSTSGYTAATATTMATALSSVLGGGIAAVDGGITSAYNTTGNPLIALGGFGGSTFPSGYLNYILFDENYVPIKAKSFPVQNLPSTRHTVQFDVPLEIKELGYLFVYLSYDNNQSNLYLYFDDLKVVVDESPLIQVNNYYPFGMVSNTWLREGEQQNANLFQGKELISQTGWHDFGSRMYWADLGRWFSTDPQKQFSSPYVGMGNMPAMGRDPNGEFFGIDDLVVSGLGFIYGYISHGIQSGDWGADAFANGGINAALFELGYLTAGGGLSATGGAASGSWSAGLAQLQSASTYLSSSAVSIVGSAVLPRVPLYQSENFSLSLTPTFSLQGIGASLDASYRVDDRWTIGSGIGTMGLFKGGSESRVAAGASYFDGTSGGSVGFTHFGGHYPQNNWIAGYRQKEFSFKTTNDLGVSGDEYRTAAFEFGLGDYSLGVNIFTSERGGGSKNSPSKIWGENVNGVGMHGIGKRIYSGLYLGYRHNNVSYRAGIDAPFVQDFVQNGWHKFINTWFGSESPYFDSGYGTPAKLYFFLRTYDPHSLY